MAFEDGLPIRVARKRKDGVDVECDIRDDLLNESGVLHGGVVASIADEAVWHAIINHFGERRPAVTTELKVNYLRPINGAKVLAKAYLVHAGRTLCVGRVDMFDTQQHLMAVAIVSYMLLDSPPANEQAR